MAGYHNPQLTEIQIACQTRLTREGVRDMTRHAGPGSMRRKGNRPTGYDKYAGARLEARRRAYDAMESHKQVGCTRPGSMQRP